MDFQSPEVRVEEVRKGPVTFPAVSPGVGAFMGKAQKGPVNEPILVYGIGDAQEVFGDFISDSYLLDAVDAFFKQGGERCYVNRVAHYTDITDENSCDAVEASSTLQTESGAATSGSLTSNASSFPAPLVAGTVFDGTVDGAGVAGFTIQATAAVITGAGATYAAGAGGDSITFTIAGVTGTQTVDLSAVGGTQAAYLAALNTVVGIQASDSGGQIRLTTDRKGSGATASITAIGGAAAAKTGLSVAAFTNAGPNNVADDRNVTAAEFDTLFEAGFPGASCTLIGTDRVTVASDSTGGSSSIQFTVPSNISTLIPGFTLSANTGSASSAAVDTLTVAASSPGTWANNWRVSTEKVDTVVTAPAVTTAGAKSSLTLASVSRVLVGDTISITKLTNTQRSVITSVDSTSRTVQLSPSITVPIGGYDGTEDVVVETFNVIVYDDAGISNVAFRNLRMSSLSDKYVETIINNRNRSPIVVTDEGASVVGDNRPDDVTSQLLSTTTSGSDGSALVDNDYIGSATSRTGCYAFDTKNDFLMISIPGITATAVQTGLESYVESRKDIFAIQTVPQGLTPGEALTHVTDTANLASSYEAVYYPWVRAVDVRTSVGASFPPEGHIQGIFARTFRRKNIGKAPAGEEDGKLSNVIGVDFEVQKSHYDVLYPANINAIQKLTGKGICVMGSRTLDPLGDFLQINSRFIFLVVKRVFLEGTRWALFENNTAATRARVTRFMKSYLRGLREATILDGATDDDAFFVQCDEVNNTPTVRAAGKLVCRVGLNVPNTIEFVYTTLERDTRALDAEIASQNG